MDFSLGIHWGYVIPSAIGTMLGAFGAYVAMRIDIERVAVRVLADREHFNSRFVTVEASIKTAHDRIDRIVSQVHK